MLYYTLSQGWEFAAMTAAGAAMAAAAPGFAAARRLLRAGIFGSLLCDCLMGVVWAAIACFALVFTCRGQARAYHFLAMLCGAMLFSAAVSAPLKRLAGGVYGVFRGIAASRVMKVLFR